MLERGGHGFEPTARVSNTGLTLTKQTTLAKCNDTAEHLPGEPEGLDWQADRDRGTQQ